jgi:hypothetical protein
MPYDESQPEPSIEPDTPNHTHFYGSDSSAGYDGTRRKDGFETFESHYSRLALLNTGIFNGKWATDESARWKQEALAIFDAIAGNLELSPFQKELGRESFGTLDLRELSSPNGIDAVLCAIMTSAIVCREDGRFYHPNRDDNTNDPLFTALIEDLGYRDRVVRSCYEKILNRVSF